MTEITHFIVTDKNKSGKPMKHLKLIAVDVTGKTHFLKFISTEFAIELAKHATDTEVIWQ